MRKIKKLLITILLLVLSVVTLNGYTAYASDDTIYLGGIPAGFSLYTKGAFVIGLCDVVGKNDIYSPSKDGGICVGDYIMSIDGISTNNALDIENAIKGKNEIEVILNRKGENIVKKIKLAKDNSGVNKLGVFIRDGINGIGTVTFIKNNKIATLGHPVLTENSEIVEVIGGCIYNCSISGCVKGQKGEPGELHGIYLRKNKIAEIEKNEIYGVYGVIDKQFDLANHKKIETAEAVMGNAKVYCTVDGDSPKEYDISIIKASNSFEKDSKNLVIKINDKQLLSITGGIVQGMSGSPILQNGKLVGAITHVFVNDPTRGYGIQIDKMLNAL